jgi:hypothetical protein
MERKLPQLLHWVPRILGSLLVCFIGMFAMDVFGEGFGFWNTTLALVMHLIPALIAAAVLAVAWRWETTGGLLYLAGALTHAVLMGARLPASAVLIIAGPVALIGLMFIADAVYRSRHSTALPQG